MMTTGLMAVSDGLMETSGKVDEKNRTHFGGASRCRRKGADQSLIRVSDWPQLLIYSKYSRVDEYATFSCDVTPTRNNQNIPLRKGSAITHKDTATVFRRDGCGITASKTAHFNQFRSSVQIISSDHQFKLWERRSAYVPLSAPA